MKSFKVIKDCGTKYYNIYARIHREEGPAYESLEGTKVLYKEGNLHRNDGPAIEGLNGYKNWNLFGKDLNKYQFNNWKLRILNRYRDLEYIFG